MIWLVWGILLLLQNASFTWVSRARNSANVLYHGIAAIASNGVWFASQFFVVDVIIKLRNSHDYIQGLGAGLFYVVITVGSSVAMHKFLMSKVEKGTRKVGA